MYYYSGFAYLSDFDSNSNTPEDVSIFIGENGSGKSTLLNNLSKYFLDKNKFVIAVANSIHDKFDTRHKNFKTLRARSGRRLSINTIKNSLKNIASDDIVRFKNAVSALEYVGFAPLIGLKLDIIAADYDILLKHSTVNIIDSRRIIYLLKEYKNRIIAQNGEPIVWLEIGGSAFENLINQSITELLIYEPVLKSLRIIKEIEVFLHKNGSSISVLNASSGELALITTIIYLSTIITENSVLLIDEPEISLHPRWQKEYVKTLIDLFYFYQPKIFIATHSPLIVNGAELSVKSTKVYKAQSHIFELQKQNLLNVEELYYKFFNLATPQNRFLSERLIRLLNVLDENKMTLEELFIEINKIESESYDPKQLEVLQGVRSIAIEISQQNEQL